MNLGSKITNDQSNLEGRKFKVINGNEILIERPPNVGVPQGSELIINDVFNLFGENKCNYIISLLAFPLICGNKVVRSIKDLTNKMDIPLHVSNKLYFAKTKCMFSVISIIGNV